MVSASMSTETFLREIDPDLVQYSSLLVSENGWMFPNIDVLYKTLKINGGDCRNRLMNTFV